MKSVDNESYLMDFLKNPNTGYKNKQHFGGKRDENILI